MPLDLLSIIKSISNGFVPQAVSLTSAEQRAAEGPKRIVRIGTYWCVIVESANGSFDSAPAARHLESKKKRAFIVAAHEQEENPVLYIATSSKLRIATEAGMPAPESKGAVQLVVGGGSSASSSNGSLHIPRAY